MSAKVEQRENMNENVVLKATGGAYLELTREPQDQSEQAMGSGDSDVFSQDRSSGATSKKGGSKKK